MPDGKKLELDFSDRERARHCETLRKFAEVARKAADALERRDDDDFMMNFFVASLSGMSTLNAIGKDLASAMKNMRKSESEFPDLIGG